MPPPGVRCAERVPRAPTAARSRSFSRAPCPRRQPPREAASRAASCGAPRWPASRPRWAAGPPTSTAARTGGPGATTATNIAAAPGQRRPARARARLTGAAGAATSTGRPPPALERLPASSIEWSRIFPRSTRGIETGTSISRAELSRLDRRANRRALRHYAAVDPAHPRARDEAARDRQPLHAAQLDPRPDRRARDALEGRDPNEPLPTLQRARGLARPLDTVDEFRKYAALPRLAARSAGGRLDTDQRAARGGHERLRQRAGRDRRATSRRARSASPARITSVLNLERGNDAAYDAIKRWRPRAPRGRASSRTWWPSRPRTRSSDADRARSGHADYLFNRLFIDAAVRGRIATATPTATIEARRARAATRRARPTSSASTTTSAAA